MFLNHVFTPFIIPLRVAFPMFFAASERTLKPEDKPELDPSDTINPTASITPSIVEMTMLTTFSTHEAVSLAQAPIPQLTIPAFAQSL